MPFNEEVPANYRPRCECKRRSCPMQDYFEDRAHGKRFFKYQCKDPKLWAGCQRWIDPNLKEAKTTEPAPAPATQPEAIKKPARPQPTKQQLEHRCKEYPFGCRNCNPLVHEKCGVEKEYRSA